MLAMDDMHDSANTSAAETDEAVINLSLKTIN